MAANTFNQFKIFSGTSTKGLEDEINGFLCKNAGHIKIVKRTMNVVSWGKAATWDPIIQIVIGYKEQKMVYSERIRISGFERYDASKRSEDWSKEAILNGAEITDLLYSSLIANTQYSHVTCILAVFLKV